MCRKECLTLPSNKISKRDAIQPTLYAGVLLVCLIFSIPSWAEDAVAAYVPPPDPVGDYLDTIERIESESSAYSTELADLYLGLGQSLLEREEYEDAIHAFQQGMQIVRVNSGLNSPEQIMYLFSIADIEHHLSGWKSAQKVVQQIQLINDRNNDGNQASMLPVLEQVFEWYSTHRPLQSPDTRYADMQRFDSLANEMAVISEQEKGFSHPDTAAIYRTIGQIHYQTTRYVMEKGINVEPGLVIYTGALPSGPYVDTVSIMDHYQAGTEAFTKYTQSVAQKENLTSLEHAEAIAQLGDWYLVFEKNKIAHKKFQQAYHILLESEESKQLADTYFADPTPVRFLDKKQDFTGNEKDSAAGEKFEVSMDVTWIGKINNTQVLNHPENMSNNQVRRLVQKLNKMRFRPRLVDGLPQATENFIWHYPITQEDYDLPWKRIITH